MKDYLIALTISTRPLCEHKNTWTETVWFDKWLLAFSTDIKICKDCKSIIRVSKLKLRL